MCQEDENGGKIRYVGRKIHILSHQLKRRRMMCEQEDGSLTATQRSVLNHILLRSMVEDVYQRDIEREFEIRRSTATGILQLLERNGLVCRECVPQDARLKKIVPTEKALALRESVIAHIMETENIRAQDIPEEDYATCVRVLKQMSENLAKQEQQEKIGGSDE